jgi:hypothetical protein
MAPTRLAGMVALRLRDPHLRPREERAVRRLSG